MYQINLNRNILLKLQINLNLIDHIRNSIEDAAEVAFLVHRW